MDTVEKQELATRTRERAALTWLSLDYGGVMAPLLGMETDLDSIARPSIENFLAISDEAWGIKEFQRDRTVELSQFEVDQDKAIADAKAATTRANRAARSRCSSAPPTGFVVERKLPAAARCRGRAHLGVPPRRASPRTQRRSCSASRGSTCR